MNFWPSRVWVDIRQKKCFSHKRCLLFSYILGILLILSHKWSKSILRHRGLVSPWDQLCWPLVSAEYQIIAQIACFILSFPVLWGHSQTPRRKESMDVQHAHQVSKKVKVFLLGILADWNLGVNDVHFRTALRSVDWRADYQMNPSSKNII